MGAADDRIHRSLFLPILDGVKPFLEMRCFSVFLESLLVPVDFIEPDTVGIFRVLNDIKSQAAGLVLQRPSGVSDHFLNEAFPVTFFDLKRCNDHIHDNQYWVRDFAFDLSYKSAYSTPLGRVSQS